MVRGLVAVIKVIALCKTNIELDVIQRALVGRLVGQFIQATKWPSYGWVPLSRIEPLKVFVIMRRLGYGARLSCVKQSGMDHYCMVGSILSTSTVSSIV